MKRARQESPLTLLDATRAPSLLGLRAAAAAPGLPVQEVQGKQRSIAGSSSSSSSGSSSSKPQEPNQRQRRPLRGLGLSPRAPGVLVVAEPANAHQGVQGHQASTGADSPTGAGSPTGACAPTGANRPPKAVQRQRTAAQPAGANSVHSSTTSVHSSTNSVHNVWSCCGASPSATPVAMRLGPRWPMYPAAGLPGESRWSALDCGLPNAA
jgi:hypothetical protein